MATALDYTKQLHQEIEQTPEACRAELLRIVHSYRESLALPSARESFIAGWKDVLDGNTHSIETLWDGIDSPEQ